MKRMPGKLLRGLLFTLLLSLISVAVVGAQAAGAVSPSDAVQALTAAHAAPGGGTAGCDTVSGLLNDCPLTGRLRDRLANPIVGVETGNLVSRSQNPPSGIDVAQVKVAEDATSVQVNTHWTYGTGDNSFDSFMTFVVLKQAGGWVVDDIYCQNDPASSVYNTPVGPCPVASSVVSGPTPGMPVTGAANNNYVLILLAALTVAGVGIVIVRRAATQER